MANEGISLAAAPIAGRIINTSSASTTITVSAALISNADTYIFYCRKSTESTAAESVNSRVVITTSSVSYTFTGLIPNTEYVINYRGVSSSGERGTTLQNPPSVYTKVAAGSIYKTESNDTSISLYGNQIPGATYYLFYCRKSSESSATQYGNSSNTSPSYTFTGLIPNTEYVINYRGVNDNGQGDTATGVTAKTTNTAPASDGYVYVYTSSGWKSAVPYIYDNGSGTWKQATPYVYSGGWKTVSS